MLLDLGLTMPDVAIAVNCICDEGCGSVGSGSRLRQ